MSELSDVTKELQDAISSSAKSQAHYDEALAKLEPLRLAAEQSHDLVNRMIRRFQELTGAEVSKGPVKKRVMKPYNISPESKINRVMKASYTRAIGAGKTEKEAKKLQADAEKSIRAKLGVS